MRRVSTAPVINIGSSARRNFASSFENFERDIPILAGIGFFMLCAPVGVYTCFKSTRPAIAGGALLGALGGGCFGALTGAAAGSIAGAYGGLAIHSMFKVTPAVVQGIASLGEDSAPKPTGK